MRKLECPCVKSYLCVLCVLCDSVVSLLLAIAHHGDTEDTKDAQSFPMQALAVHITGVAVFLLGLKKGVFTTVAGTR